MKTIALGIALLAFGTPLPRGPSPRPAAVSIRQFAFRPAEILVSIGDTVMWVNEDPFRHTTTADSSAWSSPEIARGDHFVFVALKPGRYPYHCAAHPVMRGMIVVR